MIRTNERSSRRIKIYGCFFALTGLKKIQEYGKIKQIRQISEREGYKMNNTGIKAEVIEEIRKLARKYDVTKVILFGSRARGDFKRTSDIDIAVTGGDFVRFALDVDEETSTLLEYDIVDLDNDMQDELRDSIKKEGRILYEKV